MLFFNHGGRGGGVNQFMQIDLRVQVCERLKLVMTDMLPPFISNHSFISLDNDGRYSRLVN